MGSFSNGIASSISLSLKIIFLQTQISTRSKTLASHRQSKPYRFPSSPIPSQFGPKIWTNHATQVWIIPCCGCLIVRNGKAIPKDVHDHVFASRPYTAAGKYTAYNYQNITWAPSGSQCHCNCFFF